MIHQNVRDITNEKHQNTSGVWEGAVVGGERVRFGGGGADRRLAGRGHR